MGTRLWARAWGQFNYTKSTLKLVFNAESLYKKTSHRMCFKYEYTRVHTAGLPLKISAYKYTCMRMQASVMTSVFATSGSVTIGV